MRSILDSWTALASGVVMIAWFAIAAVFLTFLVRRKTPAAPDRKREPASIAGIVLQALSYFVVWSVRRPPATITELNKPFEIAAAVLAMVLAICSVWLVSAAVRALGTQWSLAARVLEGHRLITRGPYNIVRNPIYTGMFGMLLATGLVTSHWIGLATAIVVFAVGTAVRVRSEEKLLREAFGEEFEAYARKVPAVVPFLF